MAARVEPGRVQAAHQSLHHFVAKADWSDEAVLAAVRPQVLPVHRAAGTDPGLDRRRHRLPQEGQASVGVARQYCGQLGKQDNCQVAVSLSVANDHASLPIAYRLYLPEAWAEDPDRRAKAGVPGGCRFRTKPQIALEQIRAALAAGVPPGVVLADAGYGIDTDFRDGITEIGLAYVVGIQSSTSLWPPGTAPLPPKPWSGRGRPPSLHPPRRRAQAGLGQATGRRPAEEAWHGVTWREGTQRPARLALRRRARQAGASRLLALRPAARGMVPDRMARREKPSRPNTGSPPCPPRHAAADSSTRPSCAGGSSATTRSSSRRSASVTTRGEAGAASTTTPRSAIAAYGFLVSERGAISPLSRTPHATLQSASPTRRVTDPAEPPLRPERHVVNSIATIRISTRARLGAAAAAMSLLPTHHTPSFMTQ